jgi:hypothetical protein
MAKKRIKNYKEVGEAIAEHGMEPSVLTHDEHLRGAALSLACKYYVETIVKDGNLYREMMRDNRLLKPATYMGVIEVAFNFEAYLSGELKKDLAAIVEESKVIGKRGKNWKSKAAVGNHLKPCTMLPERLMANGRYFSVSPLQNSK